MNPFDAERLAELEGDAIPFAAAPRLMRKLETVELNTPPEARPFISGFVLPLVYWPDPFLKQKATEVVNFTPEIQGLALSMEQTLMAHNAQGLSAPQIRMGLRIVTVMFTHPVTVVNPVITKWSEEKTRMPEGCLSLPGYREYVERHRAVVVEGFGPDGSPVKIPAYGVHAQAFQHEIEHLDGMLFVENLSQLKRERAYKQVKRALKLMRENDGED